MKPVICIDTLYPDLASEKKIVQVAGFGFQFTEPWDWRDKNIPNLRQACIQHKAKVANFSGQRIGSPVAEDTHQLFLNDQTETIITAQNLGCETLMLLTNALNVDERVTDPYEEISLQKKYANI